MPEFPASILSAHPEEKEDLTKGGCILVGDKNSIVTCGIRPKKPSMIKHWDEISRNLPEKTTPRAVGNPVQKIKAIIRGDIPECGPNFARNRRRSRCGPLGWARSEPPHPRIDPHAMGVHPVDKCDLEVLVRVAYVERRWGFLPTVVPLIVDGRNSFAA